MYSQDLDTAQYIINTFVPIYGDITHLKLQKLLYYLKVWGIIEGTPLIVSDFQKWEHGPVQPEIYNVYKEYGKRPLPVQTQAIPIHLKGKIKQLTDFITESYVPFHALTLSKLTHQEKPWQETPTNHIISETQIHSFYSTLSFAENFSPFDPENKSYIPVQTDLMTSFKLDMSKKEREMLDVFSSFAYYQEQVRRTHKEFKSWMENGLFR